MDQNKLDVLKKKLTPEQYNICFLKGTEPPGSGDYKHTKTAGMYHCVVCGNPLFSSETKYDSHSGWPAFWDTAPATPSAKLGGRVANPNAVKKREDTSLGMRRTEALCANCGAHLGHIFTDGPRDKTGLRYCINSLALDFRPAS